MIHRLLPVVAAVFCATLMVSCAGGPSYSEVKSSGALQPRAGKGMILIYRTPGFVSAAYKPYLYANGVELPSRLPRGGFYSLEAPPGLMNLAYSKEQGESTTATKMKATVAGGILYGGLGATMGYYGDIAAHRKVGLPIQVRPNETRYVVMGGAGGDLEEATKEDAESDLESCHWLNPTTR
jgi:hypothetical protein